MENVVSVEAPRSLNTKKILKFTLSYVVTILFVMALLHQIHFQQVKDTLARANLGLIVLGFAFVLIGYVGRGIRWGVMLKRISPQITYKTSVATFIYSMAMNNVLPLRAGDVYRIFAFKNTPNVYKTKVFSTLILERLLDLIMLLVLFFITLNWIQYSIIPPYFIKALQLLIVGATTLFFSLFLLPNVIKKVLVKLNNLPIVTKTPILPKIIEQFFHFIDAILLVRTPKYLFYIVGLTCLAWFFETSVYLCCSFALGYTGSILGPIFASSTGSLSTLIPSAPGYVGTFDYFTMLGLKTYGAEAALAMSAALIIHLLLWLPITMIGLGIHIFKTHTK